MELCINLSTEEQHKSADIEPHKKNDHRAQRSVRDGVAIEEVKVDPETERNNKPSRNSYDSTQ